MQPKERVMRRQGYDTDWSGEGLSPQEWIAERIQDLQDGLTRLDEATQEEVQQLISDAEEAIEQGYGDHAKEYIDEAETIARNAPRGTRPRYDETQHVKSGATAQDVEEYAPDTLQQQREEFYELLRTAEPDSWVDVGDIKYIALENGKWECSLGYEVTAEEVFHMALSINTTEPGRKAPSWPSLDEGEQPQKGESVYVFLAW